MAPGRLLRIPFLRGLGSVARQPVLPFSARQAPHVRSPPRGRATLSTSRGYSTQSSPSPPPSPTSDAAPKTLTGRLKALIKTHGWYALGMYAGLSALDFGLTFATIYFLGADKVSIVTNRVKDGMTQTIGWPAPSQSNSMGDIDEGTVAAGSGSGSNELYAIAILAYGIHKTLLLPVRVGLTATLTPRFVGFLQRRGWVGKGGMTRATQAMREKVSRRPSGAEA
ncbi:hypothetical protein DL93DRAFT_1246196 [Clavulina sp. PMI_390]|nr:hypothetical protein DL93DRAFT_1246196 [Clavulina sp. PMI_390]